MHESLSEICCRYFYSRVDETRVDETRKQDALLKCVLCAMSEPGQVRGLVMYGVSGYGLL